jgi:hypothetical protein
MDSATISLLAAVGGFAVPLVMLLKHGFELGRAYRVSKHTEAEYLELIVNGKDYSVDLRTINNGGSERIRDARRELERCT